MQNSATNQQSQNNSNTQTVQNSQNSNSVQNSNSSQNVKSVAPIMPITPIAPIAPISNVNGINGTSMPSMPQMNMRSSSANPSSNSNSATLQNLQNLNLGTSSENILLNALSGSTNLGTQNPLLQNSAYNNLNVQNQQNQNQTELLNKILEKINELNEKKSAAQNGNKANRETGNNFFPEQNQKILRFSINNFDILKSCKNIYFSAPESDGSFLLTFEISSYINSQLLKETLYIYFKTNGTQNGKNLFNVETLLTQSFTSTKSLIYKFFAQRDLTAEKTGNLVVLKFSKEDFSVDLLLDVKN